LRATRRARAPMATARWMFGRVSCAQCPAAWPDRRSSWVPHPLLIGLADQAALYTARARTASRGHCPTRSPQGLALGLQHFGRQHWVETAVWAVHDCIDLAGRARIDVSSQDRTAKSLRPQPFDARPFLSVCTHCPCQTVTVALATSIWPAVRVAGRCGKRRPDITCAQNLLKGEALATVASCTSVLWLALTATECR
jgi:hypothetical protein